jgi:glutamate-1-semialdehyde 2,1-aminomutase
MTLEKSLQAFERAKKVIPGGVNSPVRAFKSVGGTPPFIERGEGAYFFDIDGNKYLDYIQSWGPLIFGHNDPEIYEAVVKTAKDGLSFGAPTTRESELVEEILGVYTDMDMFRLVSSGTEAVMSAIRLARAVSGKDGIVKFRGCYHGHSDSLLVQAGSGAVTFGAPSSPGVPDDFAKHTHLAEYNNLSDVKRCFDESSDIGCVIIEPIAGNMGFVPSQVEFLKGVRALCDKHGALLIFDEVMSGFRAGFKGASDIYGVKADIVTLGKVIGGGMPAAAFGANRTIMENMSPVGKVYQAGTLSGNPIAVAAGLAQLRKIKRDISIYTKLESLSSKLISGIGKAAGELNIPLQTGFKGSMFGFFFNDKPVTNFAEALISNTEMFGKFHAKMLDNGIYLAPSQFEAGFICTAMSDETVEHTINTAKKRLEELIK